jgi:hypothetical protein
MTNLILEREVYTNTSTAESQGRTVIEKDIIQTRGFRNVGDGASPSGFQVRVRNPYYRGMWASLLEGATVAVDGVPYPAETTLWTLGDETFAPAELAASTETRWPYDEPAVLTVPKPGGLEPGRHEVQVAITWRWSYIPVELQPTTFTATKTLVLVR